MQNVDEYILGAQLPLEDLAPRYEGVIFLNCLQRTSPLLAMLAPDVVESYGILGRQALLTLFCQKPVEKCYCGKSQFFEVPLIQMVLTSSEIVCMCTRVMFLQSWKTKTGRESPFMKGF